MTQFDKRNISMMMDLYEMTMANGYFEVDSLPHRVVFDIFYRENPDEGGFAIFAGLEQLVEYIENLHFDEEDIEYFRSLHVHTQCVYGFFRGAYKKRGRAAAFRDTRLPAAHATRLHAAPRLHANAAVPHR